ncbi:hypothetical protein [Flagellimonas sp. W118]|uniref:hypothetical protein n=1 Tax=Flagellimonas sp. W118 TaxID=3410791 RepID=UPI003BF4ACCB
MAKLVLNKLLSQMGETVISHEEIDQIRSEDELKLKYSIAYQKMGVKEAIFIFNANNLLKDLHLFKMEVKRLEQESKIERSAHKVIEIPFEMAGKLIAVDVLLNGKKRKFLLDSGAPRVIVNSKYLSIKGTSPRSISSSTGVSGNINGMDIEEVEQLDFVGIQLNNQKVITLNLSHLEEELEYEIYGLIGYELIKNYDILFDYGNQMLTLVDPEHFEEYLKVELANSQLKIVSFKMERHIPTITAVIGRKELKLGIDSGAESNLINKGLFNTLEEEVANIIIEELVGAGDNPKTVKKGQIKTIKIGDKDFKDSPTLFGDISHLNKSYNVSLDGLIGYPILSKQKTFISFKRNELMFID